MACCNMENKCTDAKTCGTQSSEGPSLEKCSVTEAQEVWKGKWLAMYNLTYTDHTGKVREWESIRRTTRQPNSDLDGVEIIAILRRALHFDCLVLIKQFRPPFNAITVEFPAGLIDPGESLADCAVRETKEETGYTGQVRFTSPVTCLDPGVSNSTSTVVCLEIDGDAPENLDPKPQPDDTEHTEVLLIPLDDLVTQLKELSARGYVVSTPVYSYAMSHASQQVHLEKAGGK